MRTILIAVVMVVSVACAPSCLPESQGGGLDWPKIAKCGPGVDDIVGTVERILLSDGTGSISDRAKSELEQLAQQHGANTVACLVDLVVSGWTAPGAAPLPERVEGARRGRAFLATVGVERVERSN